MTAKIIFFTAPLENRFYPWNIDYESILSTIVLSTYYNNAELIIRVHPLEPVSFYKKKINSILSKYDLDYVVFYDQHSNVNPLLKEATAVIHFESTLFLNCINLGVPIISFAWYDFGYKKEIDKHELFYYALNLKHLSGLIFKAVTKQLINPKIDIHLFLDSLSHSTIKEKLISLITPT